MPSDVVLLTLIYSIVLSVREYLHYRQTVKLQELLKSIDITEYYRAKTGDKKLPAPSTNTVMEETPNPITLENDILDNIPNFKEAVIDGKAQNLTIIR